MAISINWATKEIFIPQADLTNISGTLYELDTNLFRLELKALEESIAGMANLDTHRHNTEVTVAGVTYARAIEIINGYSVAFEDGQYSVRLVGSNNNIFDIQNGILIQNQVQVIPTNSAGYISVSSGSGLDSTQNAKLMSLPDLATIESSTALAKAAATAAIQATVDDIDMRVRLIEQIEAGKWHITGNQMIFFEDDNTTEIMRFNLFDTSGPAETNVVRRERV